MSRDQVYLAYPGRNFENRVLCRGRTRRIHGDVLIHDYMGVDLAAVWAITQENLPALKEQIQSVLRASGDDQEE